MKSAAVCVCVMEKVKKRNTERQREHSFTQIKSHES